MRQRPTLELLEPRILYSADTPSALAGALVGTPDAEHRLLDAEGEFAAQTAPQEIVIIDARTPDSARLIEDIAAQSGRDVEVIVLDAERNGLEQISEALAGRENVAALHFIAHGGEGVMQLGNTLVTSDSLERNPGLVEAWGQVLTADADILLYGCDIAASAEGRLLADTLARLTGADVSASEDATGHANLGGDWSLEYSTGVIDVPVAMGASAQEAWHHVLGTLVLAHDPSSTTPHEIRGGAGGIDFVQTFQHDSGAGTYVVNRIDLVLHRSGGTGPQDPVVELLDEDGVTVLATATIDRSELGTTAAWLSFTLSNSVTLTDDTVYSISIPAQNPGNVFLGVEASGTYAGGALYEDGALTAKDMAFRLVSNAAPILSGANNLAAITEDPPANLGTPVSDLIAGQVTDADAGDPLGIAVTAVNNTNGSWQYSIDSGANWSAFGSPTDTAARLLAADTNTYVRFVPNANFNGTVTNGITFRAWDQSIGTAGSVAVASIYGGATAFSNAAASASITVIAVNDAPDVDLNGASAGQDVTVAFIEQTSVLVAPAGTLADVDSANLSSLTLTLTARPDGDAVESLSLNTNASNEASLAGLSVSYNTVIGVLSITGSASVATYEDILRGILYNNTSDAPSTTDRAISVVVTDDGGTQSAARMSVVSVTQLVNDAPVNNVPGAQSVNEDTALVFSAAGGNPISITDDAGTSPVQVLLASINGAITLASSAGLTFTVGDGTADSAMTFTGTVTAINAALNGMSFMPTAEFSGAASLSITASDLGNTGIGIPRLDLDTVAITVVAVNDPPVIAGAGGTLAYTEGAAATVIDGALTLSDVDDTSITSATVTISAGLVSAEDVLSFTSAFGITGIYTASTGVLALLGSATLAQYEQVLESVRYQNDNTFDPSTGVRTVTWVVNDGTDDSDGVTSTIMLAAVNDAPVNNVPGAQSINEDTALVFSSGNGNAISIADVDAGANPVQLTLSAASGVITLAGTAGLTFSLGDGTADGTMTFSGTVAAINAALDGLSFAPTSNFNGAAALEVSTSDQGNTGAGGALSDLDAVTIAVNAVNDAPTLSAVQLTVSEGGTRVFAPADFNVSDVDSSAFMYTVSAVAGGSFETFNAVTWNAAASFTTAQVAAGMVRFVDDGDEVAPSFSITANDGASTSATIAGTVSYTPVNDTPVNAVPGAQTAVEDTVFVFSNANGNAISVSDADAGTSPLQVVLISTNGALTLAQIAGLTFNIGDGVADSTMTFSGTAAAINAALTGLSFMPGAGFSGAASLSISTNDQGNTGAGGALSDSDAVAINVLPSVAPTVTTSGGTTVFTEGSNVASTPVVVDGAVTVSDPDSATLAAATISIGTGWQAAEDVLGFANDPATMGNIAGSYNAATGVLNLSSAGATATLAQWQTALRSVTYTNTSDTPNTAARSVSFVVIGQGGTSAASSQQVAVMATNDAPMVSASGGTTQFTGGGAAVVVDASVAVNDFDNGTLAAAAVWISSGFQAGQDVLGFASDPATMGNITSSYDPASGMLTLSSAGASATLSQWQAALRSVAYGNTNATPIVGARAVSFDVSDGTASALAAATHIVDVSPNPTPPDPGPIVPPPPPVIPPVVVGPPPVTPPPTTTPPPSTQPAPAPSRPAAAAGVEETPIQPVSVDIAERPHNPMAAVLTASESSVGTAPALRLAVFSTAVQGVELAGGDLLGEMMRQSNSRSETGLSRFEQGGRSGGEVVLSEEIESLRENLREQDEIQTRGTVALAAGSLSMTLAYLLWLVRGGALVASALSALPAWRILDPLPVLSRVNDDEDDEADEDEEQAIASFEEELFRARP
jgi:hypothetical protein